MCLRNVQNTEGRGVRLDASDQPGEDLAQSEQPLQQAGEEPQQTGQQLPVHQPHQPRSNSGVTHNFNGSSHFVHCFNVSIEDTLDHFLIDACLRLQLIDRNDLLLQYSQLP
jgi:hypothetical protein